MFRKTMFSSLLAASALALTISSPAHAGKEDRARAAIAAAEAKLQTADTMGAATELPQQAAEARAALARAREHLSADRNTQSIDEAIRAQSLADAAIGELQKTKQQALSAERSVADAAGQQAAAAQQDAADANARAAAAERSAAASAAEARAARSALADSQAVETTVTTQQPATTARRATKTTVKRTAKPAKPAGEVTTTTTVTQPSR